MTFKIERHPLAWRDIDEIADFIGQYAGLQIAERKTFEIERSIASLRTSPHIGSPRNEIAEGLRLIPSAAKAIICFTVDDERRTVRIICVTYGGQDWQRIARERHDS